MKILFDIKCLIKLSDLIFRVGGVIMNQTSIIYPALIYKSKKNNIFVANCIIKKLIGYGHSEYDAVKNLEYVLNGQSSDYPVKIKPVYSFLPELDIENNRF